MKPILQPRPAGVALVIVLSFLVLISAIILGFFSSVATELTSSKAVATSATTQQLAESAVNIVMAQMVDATKGGATNAPLAWASQPGLIRTFNNSGEPKDFYKLYSSDRMTVDGTGFNASADAPPADWNSEANSEHYVDLNAPASNAQAELIYPVVDPSAEILANGQLPTDVQVAGFSISSRPGYVSGKPESAINNRAPMPVKWLYVLKDGSVKSPLAPTPTGVTVADASATNPIVGRIAFWADDETAKVNINTASEGTYWDVPRIYSMEDFGRYSGSTVQSAGFSVCQPVQKEYQRYPGHPATTCLSPIFGKFLLVTSPYPANPTSTQATQLDPYYNIAPRVGLPTGTTDNISSPRTSRGGSQQVPSSNNAANTTDTDRLYASVDELMFTPNLTGTGTARIPNTSNAAAPTKITKGVLEKAKFFLTAHSTAPETTLNNTPRVAVWPVGDTEGKRTAYDKLLAFCSTIGGKAYYFTRANSRSSTADFTPRNAALYSYLQKITDKNIPGFGGSFIAKYPVGSHPSGASDRDQILTCLFDYIRCTNLQDQSTGATPYTPLFHKDNPPLGAGEVIPIRINQTQGFGRFYSITSANLLFYGTGTNKMRAVFFLGLSSPMQGLGCMRSQLKYEVVSGLDGLQANGKSLNFKHGGTNFIDMADLHMFHGRSVGGTESPWMAIRHKKFDDADAGGAVSGKYPFFSKEDVDTTGTPATGFAFKSTGEIVVNVRTADPNTNEVVQTLRFKFPDGSFKLPKIVGGGATATFNSRNTGGDYQNLINLEKDTVVSLQVGGADLTVNATNPPDSNDDATVGDVRMIAALRDVPANRYRADKAYRTPNVQFAHCLVQSIGEYFNGARYGELADLPAVPELSNNWTAYRQTDGVTRQPDIPSRASAGVARSGGGRGDWDTGFGDQKDGAYINKPDEGDTALLEDAGGVKRLPYMLGWNIGWASATNVYFSPNRQIPSPLMFGSIPTGIQRMQPWQTLLFHPRPEDATHPGKQANQPKDHLLADLFWMPVVEPYAISQPFATAGKINLNYQIVPFTYINRSTGLHAVMKGTKFAALDPAIGNKYKPLDASGSVPTAPNSRRSIDMTKTLAAFDAKFANNEIFKSASQICEMNLVPPEVASAAGMASFWNSNTLTGDNLREKPYADLYSRLTTKSNTYSVHVRVQTLRKAPGTPADQWVRGKDQVAGEYRGSSILERYIDLNDPNLATTDFATNPTTNIDSFYKMRVVSTKRFAP